MRDITFGTLGSQVQILPSRPIKSSSYGVIGKWVKRVFGQYCLPGIFLLLALSCTPAQHRHAFIAGNQAGFKYFSASFRRIPAPAASIDIKVPIDATVHVVSILPAGCDDMGYGACAYPDGRIYVMGKFVAGKVVVNQAVLGHELMHLLNWKNDRIADPDTLY